MSVDIYSGEAVYLAYSDFLGLFQPAHLDGLRQDALQLFRVRHAEVEDELAEDLISRLQQSESLEGAIQVLSELGDKPFDLWGNFIGYDRGGEVQVEGSWEFYLVMALSHLVLPTAPTGARSFDSHSSFGMRGAAYADLERDVLYLEFEFAKCFLTTVTMTGAGRALADAIGKSEIVASKWACVE